MKIAVLNGSPKGMASVTMQYVAFLQKKLPQHQFVILNVCHDVKTLENDREAFQKNIKTVAEADGVLWAFPLYYMLVAGNYKRFIELLFERDAAKTFQNKYAAVLTTSIHFFDHTAHQYLNAICDDLGMNYVGGYSAAMDDLLEEPERKRFLLFADGFFSGIAKGVAMPRRYRPIVPNRFVYQPNSNAPLKKIDAVGKNVVIVSDCQKTEENLANMVARLEKSFDGKASVVNLREINIRGGCLGCCQCGLDNQCVYQDADDVQAVYEKLMAADIVIFAGKQMGYLISGPLAQMANLRQVLEAYVECQQANMVGIVTDECDTAEQLDRFLESFAARLVDFAAAGYVPPPSFLRFGAAKLFRDEIWANLRFVFRMDHRYYKTHGLYDFPKRSLKRRAFEAVFSVLLLIPAVRREFRKRIKDEMIKPLQKMIEKL